MGLGPGVGLASYFNVDNAPGDFGGACLRHWFIGVATDHISSAHKSVNMCFLS